MGRWGGGGFGLQALFYSVTIDGRTFKRDVYNISGVGGLQAAPRLLVNVLNHGLMVKLVFAD